MQMEACPNCGAEDWRVEELGRVELLLRWLRSARPAPRARMTCRNCGTQILTHRGASTAVYSRRRTQAAWWGAPIRVLRILSQARTAIPAPWIYLAAGAAGTLLGLGVDLVLGWPWWAVALGMVAGVWVLFLLTAFKAAGRRMPQSLWGELLDALDPKGSAARWIRLEEEALRRAPFPLYGLPASWEGPRFLGGMGWGGMGREADGLTSVDLAHGDPQDPQAMHLRVSSDVGGPELPRELGARDLAEGLWRERDRPPPGLPPERFRLWVEARELEYRRTEIPAFSQVEIRVDGEPVPFDHFSQGLAWVAVGRWDGVTITLHARNLALDEIELVRVENVEPYIEGSRALRERWRDHDGLGR